MFNEMMPVTMPNVDLSQDTVTPDKVFQGYTFHDKNDQPQVGTYEPFVVEVYSLGSQNNYGSAVIRGVNTQTGTLETNTGTYCNVSYNSSTQLFTVSFKQKCYARYYYNGTASSMSSCDIGTTYTFDYKNTVLLVIYSRSSL